MRLIALGTVLGQSGKFDGAIKALKEAIKISPDAMEAYIPLAMAYRGKNMLDEALEILHQVEEKKISNSEDPSVMDFDLYFTFATIYVRKDDRPNAVKYAKKAIKANDNPVTKKEIDEAIKFGVINSGEPDRTPMIEGLRELIKEYEEE